VIRSQFGGRINENLVVTGDFPKDEGGWHNGLSALKALKLVNKLKEGPLDSLSDFGTCSSIALLGPNKRLTVALFPQPIQHILGEDGRRDHILGDRNDAALLQRLALFSPEHLKYHVVLVKAADLSDRAMHVFAKGKAFTRPNAPDVLKPFFKDGDQYDGEYFLLRLRGCTPIKNGVSIVQGTQADAVHASLEDMSEAASNWFELATEQYDPALHHEVVRNLDSLGGLVPSLKRGQAWADRPIEHAFTSVEDDLEEALSHLVTPYVTQGNTLATLNLEKFAAEDNADEANDAPASVVHVPAGGGARDDATTGTTAAEMTSSQYGLARVQLLVSPPLCSFVSQFRLTLTFLCSSLLAQRAASTAPSSRLTAPS
jgi:hypothetical protein